MTENINELFLNEFYKFSEQDKNLIIWALTQNKKIDEKLFNDFLLKNFTENKTVELKKQWERFQKKEKNIKLKNIDKKAIVKLKKDFKELDGTLLKDVVYEFFNLYDIIN